VTRGVASYYHVRVHNQVNSNAAWFYPATKAAAAEIKDYIASWHGVKVEEHPSDDRASYRKAEIEPSDG
jgi:uncharacterized protein (DUF427 family)